MLPETTEGLERRKGKYELTRWRVGGCWSSQFQSGDVDRVGTVRASLSKKDDTGADASQKRKKTLEELKAQTSALHRQSWSDRCDSERSQQVKNSIGVMDTKLKSKARGDARNEPKGRERRKEDKCQLNADVMKTQMSTIAKPFESHSFPHDRTFPKWRFVATGVTRASPKRSRLE